MIARVVRWALQVPAIVGILAVVLVGLGLWSYSQLDVEAYPNPVPPMIEVIAQPTGLSGEEVERYVTVPLETGLSGMPGLASLRSQSLFGLADVKCYFDWSTSYADARQEVINRLQFIQLPANVQAQLSPANPVGEIYRYVLRGKGYSLTELKTAQDWVLEKQFRQVPGVVDVVGFGGLTKQYQVEVDPFALKSHALALPQLLSALSGANQNVGGQRLTLGEQSYDVRGIGLIGSLRDLGEVVIAAVRGTPVRVRDVATVKIGAAPQLGLIGKDGEPQVVQGIVLMRYGGDSLRTLEGVHAKVEEIRALHLLPPGMEIAPYYDRADLVRVTTRTVLENLLVGMGLVSLVLLLFLGRLRAALVTALNIPLSLLFAFAGMVATGTAANLISLGAVDFGIVVDSTVIMVENIFRHLAGEGDKPIPERVADAAAEVGPPMLFSTLVIATAFVPLLTLTGAAGVIFAPMAHTYAFAIGGAILLALTLTPALASRLLKVEPRASEAEHEGRLMRWLDRVYAPLFAFSLQRKAWALGIGGAVVALGLGGAALLGGEFMPKLEEGNFYIRASLPTSISLEQASSYVDRMRSLVLGCPEEGACEAGARRHPEVRTAVSQLGRPDDGTDVSGFSNIEIFAPLEPRERWRRGQTKERMTQELDSELHAAFPGVVFNFSQAIADNVEEAMSGVKGENTVKVVGSDLRTNEAIAEQLQAVMAQVPGVEDLGVFTSLGQPTVRITPDRGRAGRYGLNVGDVEALVQAAVGGQAVTQVFEGDKHFDLVVRWAPQYRKDLKAIENLLVPTPDGAQIPLGQVAQVVVEEGASVVYRENARRYTPVKFSVRGRDLASTIAEAQRRIAAGVRLPYDSHLEWAGEIDQLQATGRRLAYIVPLTLLAIAFLVHALVKRLADTLVVFAGIPVACAGGVLALLVTGTDFSISAAMGFISIFGIAVQDSLIVVTYAKRLWAQGLSLEEGARLAAARRLRPVLMTTSVAMIGLLPAALSRGIGSETQKPLAIVVIGGALVLAVVPRLVQPALLVLAHRRDARHPEAGPAAPEGAATASAS